MLIDMFSFTESTSGRESYKLIMERFFTESILCMKVWLVSALCLSYMGHGFHY